MIDITAEINAAHRAVAAGNGRSGHAHVVRLRRRYDAAVDEVWDACTNPERIARWFLPVSGDLRAGGRYQLEGNAGGEILRCEPPRLLRLTWVFGDGPASQVEVRLSPGGQQDPVVEHTVLELEHALADTPQWAEFGPGAVGVGWDGMLLGLGRFLTGEPAGDRAAWPGSPEGREFYIQSSRAWGAAFEASGATAAEAAAATRRTTAFYAPGPS